MGIKWIKRRGNNEIKMESSNIEQNPLSDNNCKKGDRSQNSIPNQNYPFYIQNSLFKCIMKESLFYAGTSANK